MQQVEERESITLINQEEKIFGILHRPLHASPVPAVLICPGFAGTKCGKHRLFVRLAKELAKRGVAVFRFDYRGSGDSEGEFEEITLESKISDTLECLKFLAQDPQIDPNRMGLLGRSLGGVISILSAKRYKNIKSLALWAPVFNSDPWKALWEAFQSQQGKASFSPAALPLPAHVPNLQFLAEFFKMNLQEDLQALSHIPLLHIHGEQDKIVKIEHAQKYKEAREDSVQTRFVHLPNSDHDFSDANEQELTLAETCAWYLETL